jgi:hypothetical protein
LLDGFHAALVVSVAAAVLGVVASGVRGRKHAVPAGEDAPEEIALEEAA